MKDSQINTLSIPDRIRGPHLHAALTYPPPSFPSLAGWVRSSWPHTPLPAGQAKGHYAFLEGLFGIKHLLIAAPFVEDSGQPQVSGLTFLGR